MKHVIATGLLAMVVALPSAAMSADWTEKISLSGFLESDIRYLMEDYRGTVPGDGYRFDMNRNDFDLKLTAVPTKKVKMVADARLRFYGMYDSLSFSDLHDRKSVDPWDFQLNEAYVAIKGTPWSMMDFRIGRMSQTWGTADMFNPTDNLSARDLSDPLDYFTKVPNEMIELNIYPTDWLTITAVWVPIFKPSLLPMSAESALAMERDSQGRVTAFPAMPVDTAALQNSLGDDLAAKAMDLLNQGMTPEQILGLLEAAGPLISGTGAKREDLIALIDRYAYIHDVQVNAATPGIWGDFDFSNSQAALKAQFNTGPVDFSLSYYYGRFTFPVALNGAVDLIMPNQVPVIAPTATQTPELVPGKINALVVAEMYYPRMQVIGADLSYTSENEWVPGFFAEAAVIFPEQVNFGLRVFGNSNLLLDSVNVNVPDTPFVKATAGFDWSYGDWIYVNMQYVRGFFDEFNDMYGIHNYFVPALEFMFLENELQFRLAGALNCDDLSFMVNPHAKWIVAPGVELILGYMGFFGSDEEKPDTLDFNDVDATVAAFIPDYATKSRFGQKAAGRNFVFFKAKVTF